jgi:hypothetical protein
LLDHVGPAGCAAGAALLAGVGALLMLRVPTVNTATGAEGAGTRQGVGINEEPPATARPVPEERVRT